MSRPFSEYVTKSHELDNEIQKRLNLNVDDENLDQEITALENQLDIFIDKYNSDIKMEYAKVGRDIVWETARGVKIPLSKIATSHLNNLLNYIKRQGYNTYWTQIFEEELENRG